MMTVMLPLLHHSLQQVFSSATYFVVVDLAEDAADQVTNKFRLHTD